MNNMNKVEALRCIDRPIVAMKIGQPVRRFVVVPDEDPVPGSPVPETMPEAVPDPVEFPVPVGEPVEVSR